MHGYRPAHYDYAFDYRTVDYPRGDQSYSTFGRTFDLFGDGSVRLASTPGHTAGHQSVICRLADRDLVIAGDAFYTLSQLGESPARRGRTIRTPSAARCRSCGTSPASTRRPDPPGPRPGPLAASTSATSSALENV